MGTRGEYNDTVMSGAHSGSTGGFAIGNSFMPGIGGAIGAVAGGLGGLFTGFRKAEREREAKRARERAWQEAQRQMAEDRYRAARTTDRIVRGAYSPANESLVRMYGENANLDMSQSPLTYYPEHWKEAEEREAAALKQRQREATKGKPKKAQAKNAPQSGGKKPPTYQP